MRNFGAIVIVLGLVMTTLTGFNTVSRTKGAPAINAEVDSPVYWSPVTGGVLVVVGAVLVMVGSKKEQEEYHNNDNDKG